MAFVSTRVAGLVAAAGLCGLASASDTTIRYEVSPDGVNWSSAISVERDTTVQVRARVEWSGSQPVFGLSQIAFQPVISGWGQLGDTLLTTRISPSSGSFGVGPVGGSRSTPVGVVDDVPGAWGRITPFGANATTNSTYLRGFTGTGAAAGLLRIAQANVTNWIGEGPTSGIDSNNNWNGGGGVSIAQISPAERIATDLPFQASSNVVVFKFGFTLSGNPVGRTLSINTPTSGLGVETSPVGTNYGRVYASWFTTSGAITGTRFYDSVSTIGATVNVLVPAPGVGALLALAGLVASRRKRVG